MRSESTAIAYARVRYRINPKTQLTLDVFNLFDRKASDIDYYYTSLLNSVPAAGVDDIHSRRLRITLVYDF